MGNEPTPRERLELLRNQPEQDGEDINLRPKVQSASVELWDINMKVFQVERYSLLLSPEVIISVLTAKEEGFPSIHSGFWNSEMVLEVYRYGMKCLASDQGGDPWVSKTVKKAGSLWFLYQWTQCWVRKEFVSSDKKPIRRVCNKIESGNDD